MLVGFKRGATGIIVRVKIRNSSVSTGAGLTGLTFSSSGLRIAAAADNEAAPTTYTSAGSTIETISTLGTYAAPTATKCRFKEYDATNHPGVYEIQLADARYAVSSAKFLLLSISGATNAAETDVVIPLRDLDPYDSVRAGLTALPNAAAEASGGLATLSAAQASNGTINANVHRWLTSTPNALQSGRVDAYMGAVATGVIAAASFAANALDAVWSTTTRLLTGGTNIVLAKGTGITGFNDLSAAQVNAEADTALADVGLTTTITGRIDAAVSTRLASASYTAPLDAAGTRTAVGLASANLDTQLGAIASSASSASSSASSAATDAATVVSRLTSTRAGNLDNLDRAISAVLTTAMTESYNTDGVAPTPAQALFVIMQRLTEFAISGTSITVKKLDGSTTALTLTLNDATDPTSSTRSA